MHFYNISDIKIEYKKELDIVEELELKFTDVYGEHKYLLKNPEITSSKILGLEDNHWDILQQKFSSENNAESVYIWERHRKSFKTKYTFEIHQKNDRIIITCEEYYDLNTMNKPLA